jgi:hypothetical protein
MKLLKDKMKNSFANQVCFNHINEFNICCSTFTSMVIFFMHVQLGVVYYNSYHILIYL